ncbi:hypothetical protein M3Y97_01117000 [Aphelenchoides bicaudatus]|nr:hypothetical protein M3Y97_01117000 [Aphelenchoides bicaudatus]
MYSDALMTVVLHAQMNPIPLKYLPASIKEFAQNANSQKAIEYPSITFQSRLDAFTQMIMEICGDQAQISYQDSNLIIKVDDKEAQIDAQTLQIKCNDDLLHHLLTAVCQKISQTLAPIGKA